MEAEVEFQNAVSILKELERQKEALSDEVIQKVRYCIFHVDVKN
jgi:hypothetical protein